MSEWLMFAVAVILTVSIIYIPGFLFSRVLSRSTEECIAWAPAFSMCVYSCLGVVYSILNIRTGVFTLFVPVTLLSGILYALFRKRGSGASPIILSKRVLLLSMLLGLVASFVLFVLPLDGPSSFNQDADNTWHLSLIRSFAETGDMSSIGASLFKDSDLQVSVMPTVGSFYPSAWHMLAALVLNMLSISVPMSANATLFVFLSLVWPISCSYFVSVLFPRSHKVQLCTAVSSVAFLAFPWAFLTFGPLYPNLVGLSMVPLGCAIFICALSNWDKRSATQKLVRFTAFAICTIALTLAHPNSLFSMALVLIPYVISFLKNMAQKHWEKRGLPYRRVCIAIPPIVFLVAVAVMWVVLRNLSFFTAVVSFNWEKFADPAQEIINILTLSYRVPIAQPILAACVIIGIALLIVRRNNRWLVGSYFLAIAFCFIGATSDGQLKSVLTGYWYTDPYRLAATAVLIAVPLSAIGIARLAELLNRAFNVVVGRSSGKIGGYIISVVAVGALVFYPSYAYPGRYEVETATGYISDTLTRLYSTSRDNLFDRNEMRFAEKVKGIVDPSAKIYNCADDGSTFAYALYGLNLCYRRSDASADTEYGSLLRHSIDELSDNEQVKKVLREANIHYILILDQGGEALPERCFYGYYNPDDWDGLNNITDSTPGLKLLLSEGDMRLYEIE